MITGFAVRACSFCGATQMFLHLHTKKPCFVRCGRCGAHGPHGETIEEAVVEWNVHVDDVANGGSRKSLGKPDETAAKSPDTIYGNDAGK